MGMEEAFQKVLQSITWCPARFRLRLRPRQLSRQEKMQKEQLLVPVLVISSSHSSLQPHLTSSGPCSTVCSWLCTCHCSIALSLPMQTFSSPLSSQWLLSTCCHRWLFRQFSTSQSKILLTWRSRPLVTPVCTLLRTWALAIC